MTEAADSVPAERKPTGAVAGHCFDINGDSWHKDGQVCKHCGFGVQSEQDGDAERLLWKFEQAIIRKWDKPRRKSVIENYTSARSAIAARLRSLPVKSEQDGDAEREGDADVAWCENWAAVGPPSASQRGAFNERMMDIAARLRSLPEPEWSPAYINALLEVEGLSRAVHCALVNEPEKLQCDSFCGPEECLFCDWTRALDKVSHLPSSPLRVKSEPEAEVERMRRLLRDDQPAMKSWRVLYLEDVTYLLAKMGAPLSGAERAHLRVQPIANNDEELRERIARELCDGMPTGPRSERWSEYETEAEKRYWYKAADIVLNLITKGGSNG